MVALRVTDRGPQRRANEWSLGLGIGLVSCGMARAPRLRLEVTLLAALDLSVVGGSPLWARHSVREGRCMQLFYRLVH